MKLKNHLFIVTFLLLVTSLFLSGCNEQQTTDQPSNTPTLLLDTFNNKTCSHTNSTTFTFNTTTTVTRITLWYHWSKYETTLSYKIYENTTIELMNGTLTREENCDLVESMWCNATTTLNQTFQPGTYQLLVPNNQIGMNNESNHEGFIKIYGIKT